ncbi:MAG: hypothetical protein JWN71_1335 [Xanthobacteraceae bacterium]|nr:hypothetical protein [Xanthobacteraceae bacterium]
MQAAVDRDADAAVRLLNTHFEKTAELVKRVVGAPNVSATARATRKSNSRRQGHQGKKWIWE